MKVTASNYLKDIEKVDWSKLPKDLKEDAEKNKLVAKFYSEGGDIKAGLDAYVAALNKELSKVKPEETLTLNQLEVELNRAKDLNPRKIDYWKERIAEKKKELSKAKPKPAAKKKTAAKSSAKKKPVAKKTTTKRTQSKAEAAKAKKAYEADKAKAMAGKFAGLSRNEVLAIAQRVHRNRRLSAQIVDEAADHKKRLSPTPENLVRWMKEPGKFDLIGVDTFKKDDPTADLKIRKEIFWNRLLKK